MNSDVQIAEPTGFRWRATVRPAAQGGESAWIVPEAVWRCP